MCGACAGTVRGGKARVMSLRHLPGTGGSLGEKRLGSLTCPPEMRLRGARARKKKNTCERLMRPLRSSYCGAALASSLRWPELDYSTSA
eukprot:gene17140-biopygen14381